MQAVRIAFRRLRRRGTFTVGVAACAIIGIGINSATATVVDTVLFRPPPGVRDAEQVKIAHLRWSRLDGGATLPMMTDFGTPLVDVAVLRHIAGAFDGVTAYGTRRLLIGAGATASPGDVVFATAGFFPTLGVQMALGRPVTDTTGGSEVVLGYDVWNRMFDRDPRVLGTALRIGQRRYTIVGVAPRGFHGVGLRPVSAWLAAVAARDLVFDGSEDAYQHQEWWTAITRLAPGLGLDRAQMLASMATQRAYTTRYGAMPNRLVTVELSSVIGSGVSALDDRVAVYAAALSLTILVIACINIAGLYAARAVAERTETAVQLALGASPAHLLRRQLLEAAIVMGASGVLAFGLAAGFARLLLRLLLPGTQGDQWLSAWHLAAGVGVFTLLTWLAGSGVPAWQAVRGRHADDLRRGQTAGTGFAARARHALLATQCGGTVVLLVLAALFVHSLRHASGVALGVALDGIAVATYEEAGPTDPRYAESAARVVAAVRRIPGVQTAASALALPLVGADVWPGFDVPGAGERGAAGDEGQPVLHLFPVSDGYFEALHVRHTAGRVFEPRDMDATHPTVVVNATFAARYFPARSPIGECLKIAVGGRDGGLANASCREIIGVVADTRTRLPREPDALQAYLPLGQWHPSGRTMVVARTTGAPATLLPALRAAVARERPTAASVDAQTYTDIAAPLLGGWRLGATLFTVFGGVAFVLSLCGVHAAAVYAAEQRVREIGVRLALGATPPGIRRLFLRGTIGVVAVSALVGTIAALGVAGAARAMLFGAQPTDAWAYVLANAAVAVGAIGATLPVAWRASRLGAVEALRS
jgi:predicted permease